MKAFTTLEGIAALLDKANVDTDQIIPKQFLRKIEMIGLFSSLQGSLGAACSSRSMERVPRNSKAGVFFCSQKSQSEAKLAVADAQMVLPLSLSNPLINDLCYLLHTQERRLRRPLVV